MLTYALLDYDRPKESELCLKSIHKYSHFPFNIVYLSNGGNQDYVMDFYKQGLIDKLILRKSNSGCGLGTRECFNDFNLESEFIVYVQTDQFLTRDFNEAELKDYIDLINKYHYFYIDMAGNQGNGRFSERAFMMKKGYYQSIPNTIGGPGPLASEKWTEQSVQEYIERNRFVFYSAKPLFADNGKNSIRQYPCGGQLLVETDTKKVHIIKSITKRVDFPNIKLTDLEWNLILKNEWINGTVPEQQKQDSFLYWKEPFNIDNLPK